MSKTTCVIPQIWSHYIILKLRFPQVKLGFPQVGVCDASGRIEVLDCSIAIQQELGSIYVIIIVYFWNWIWEVSRT